MSAVKELIEILTWQRGANTKSESDFVALHIATIPGIQRDDYGNYHLQIGDDDPDVLWSCHTDTVTRNSGRQNVKWLGNGLLGLNNGKPGQCLGADDGAGLWLMLQMIQEGKPGYYVFHRDEEIGGLGSRYLSNNSKYFPPSIQIAIAMDRSGTSDVITHQAFSRCCSDDFAKALAHQLGGTFRPDDTGVFTDTANYVGLFGECTNLSVGYERNHGPMETLDVDFLQRLRDSLLKLDTDSLPVCREPGEDDYSFPGGMYSFGSGGNYSNYPWGDDDEDVRSGAYPSTTQQSQLPQYKDLVMKHPDIAARLLEELGVEEGEFRAHVFAFTGVTYGT